MKMKAAQIHSSRRTASTNIQTWKAVMTRTAGLVSSELQSDSPDSSEANKKTVGCAAMSMAEKLRGERWIANKLFAGIRSEEHTSEFQLHSFISYAVFCLKKKKKNQDLTTVRFCSFLLLHTHTSDHR